LFKLSEKQKTVLNIEGHLLVSGGPGSGKTTISILKADALARTHLHSSQKILFLSFARSTVSRVLETIHEHSAIINETKRLIEVDTYHSFFWRIIKTHGYLLGLPRKLTILAAPAEAIALSQIRNEFGPIRKLTSEEILEKKRQERAEQYRLAQEDGLVCFDLFAEFAGGLLSGSNKIQRLISSAFPFVILDEFQDTSAEQWALVKQLGKNSSLIALADPNQRIYDFIGADPERIAHYKQFFKPTEVDLAGENHRSANTDLAEFGNDLLTGEYKASPYKGLSIVKFAGNRNQAFSSLKVQCFQARRRLMGIGKSNWSLGILVPTKKMVGLVSDAFRMSQGSMSAIRHHAAVDMEGAILAAELLAFLLQPKLPQGDLLEFIELLCDFFLGKGGNKPTKKDIAESKKIQSAMNKAEVLSLSGKKLPPNSILWPLLAGYKDSRSLRFIGDPDKDWLSIRATLRDSHCKRLNKVADEARNIRLLNRGTRLRQALSQDWRKNGSYLNALHIVKQSFVKEHFSTSLKPETGVVVMNMHKAKGKQFDEVILFEGWPIKVRGNIVSNPDRILRDNTMVERDSSAMYNFRVSVTRAIMHTTIMTPIDDPCVLLLD